MRGPAGRLWRGFPSVLSFGESPWALFRVLAAAACLGRLRTLLWSVLAVLVVPVGALTAGAGQRVGGLRRRLVASWTGPKVPASPGEAGSVAASRDDRFFGLRRQNGRRKAGPGRQDAGQADGTAVVPVRLHAGEKKNILGRLAGMGCVSAGGWRYAAG